MAGETPKHSSFDMVRPEFRDLAKACVGNIDPESAFGQHLIASAYMFSLNYGSLQYTADQYRALAGEAAAFSERAWRLSTPDTPFRVLDLQDAIRLYGIAGNKEKANELLALS